MKDDEDDNDDGEDDENGSNDDYIDDFDEDNDSKSEVNQRKKLSKCWATERKALDTAEEGSPKKKVCFIYNPTNSCLFRQNVEKNGPMHLTSWPNRNNREKVFNRTNVLYKWRFCGRSRPGSLTTLIESCY